MLFISGSVKNDNRYFYIKPDNYFCFAAKLYLIPAEIKNEGSKLASPHFRNFEGSLSL